MQQIIKAKQIEILVKKEAARHTPRPLSVMLTELSAHRMTSTFEANPACASSTALSKIS